MGIERLENNGRFSQVVKHNGTLYLAGQTSSGDDDVVAQTKRVFANIDKLLEAHGSHKSKLLSALVCLKNIGDVAAFNQEWVEWLPAPAQPTRACIESKFVQENILIEIIVVAACE